MNYNNYYTSPQNNQMQQQNNNIQMRYNYFGLKGRPVSSIEEARAQSIDFDGSIFYFPDIANKRIYTKQINLDGTATLNMYEIKEIPVQPTALSNNYITREEFDSAITELKKSLTSTPEVVNQKVPPVVVESKPQPEQPVQAPAANFNF